MLFLRQELRFRITPKSGPLRQMDTLHDAQRALTCDLPPALRKREHWRQAGWAVVKAVDTGDPQDVSAATELLVEATNAEGWMSRGLRL